MSYAEVFQAVRDRFVDEVATPNGMTVLHDNAPSQSISSPWYRLEVQTTGTEQIACGPATGRRYRITGQCIVTMAARVEQGDGALLAIGDLIVAAFRGVQLDSPIIYFGAPSIVGSAARDEAWFQRAMNIPFEADVFG
jgi:hypothetical protein